VPGDAADSSHSVGGDDYELTMKTMTLRTWFERCWEAKVVLGFPELQLIEHVAHAKIVRHEAIHKMNIGAMTSVEIGFELCQVAY
jgi:hypothetical protein